jgi:hypothetical protein
MSALRSRRIRTVLAAFALIGIGCGSKPHKRPSSRVSKTDIKKTVILPKPKPPTGPKSDTKKVNPKEIAARKLLRSDPGKVASQLLKTAEFVNDRGLVLMYAKVFSPLFGHDIQVTIHADEGEYWLTEKHLTIVKEFVTLPADKFPRIKEMLYSTYQDGLKEWGKQETPFANPDAAYAACEPPEFFIWCAAEWNGRFGNIRFENAPWSSPREPQIVIYNGKIAGMADLQDYWYKWEEPKEIQADE